MTKKVLKKKSFAEIAKLKKSIDIKNENEILFTLYEPSQIYFNESINKILIKVLNSQSDEENQINIITYIENEIVPFLFKKMYDSQDYSIDELSDKEVLESLKSFGTDIAKQINEALDELVIKKINVHFETLKNVAKSVEE